MSVIFRLLIALAVLCASCSSQSETGTTEPLDGASYLSRCEFQVLAFPFVRAGEELFKETQAAVAEGTTVSRDHRNMVNALTQPLDTATARFTHMRRAKLVVPGETTLSEFRQATGLLEYIDYMSNAAGDATRERSQELLQRFDRQLQIACEAHEEEFLSEACAAGDSEACRLVDNLDQLDPAIVAEACELTPYMLFCDPEDPIPWELPPLDDE